MDKTRRPFDNRYTQQFNVPYVQHKTVPFDLINKLFLLAYEGNAQKIQEFYNENKTPIHLKNQNDETILHVILSKNPNENNEYVKLNLINLFPEMKSLVLVPNKLGVTPLHLAAMYQYSKIIKILCSGKMDVSPKDNFGLTPLHYAVIGTVSNCPVQAKIEDTEIGVKKYTNLDIDEKRVIIGAISHILGDHIDLTQKNAIQKIMYRDDYLVESFANKCINVELGVIDTLLFLRANVNSIDNFGMTPIFYALRNLDDEVITRLMATYKSIDLPINSSGDSPRMYFIQNYKLFLSHCLSTDSNIIENFTRQSDEKIRNFIHLSNKFTHNNHDILQKSFFVMLNEMIRFECENDPNAENELRQINNSFDIGESKHPLSGYNYPITDVITNINIGGAPFNVHHMKPVDYNHYIDISDFYDTILRTTRYKCSLYNSLWKQYLFNLNNGTSTLFLEHLAKLQNAIIDKTLPNNAATLNSVINIYSIIIGLNTNDGDDRMNKVRNYIAVCMTNTVFYDMYKKILVVVIEKLRPLLQLNLTPLLILNLNRFIRRLQPLNELLIEKFPKTFVNYYLIGHFNDIFSAHIQPNNINDLFSNLLFGEIKTMIEQWKPLGFPTIDDIIEEMVNEIRMDVMPHYEELCKTSCDSLLELANKFFGYIEHNKKILDIHKRLNY